MSPKPLLIREGARYACFSDGLCCTDAHALGPVTASEVTRLTVLRGPVTRRHDALDIDVLTTRDHHCTFLRSDGLCDVHVKEGASAKPRTCQQFPFGLVSTPSGMRVTTEHRCPCRTLGERPLLKASEVRQIFPEVDEPDLLVDYPIAMNVATELSFAEYEYIERELLTRLAAGDDALDVLVASPWPSLDGVSWLDASHLFRALLDGSACGDALASFGDVILAGVSERKPELRQRSWGASFDRAEARTHAPQKPQAMLNDFVADNIWSLAWTDCTFAQARAELATRVVIANVYAAKLEAHGVRSDRAMAEALLVVELGGSSSLWRQLVHQMVVP
ncbi:MAG: hypothetical protein IPK60_05895 [Sandaracinaceae bacterium]|nr:hypothetical protein [Sandaracinaceae bacterium]